MNKEEQENIREAYEEMLDGNKVQAHDQEYHESTAYAFYDDGLFRFCNGRLGAGIEPFKSYQNQLSKGWHIYKEETTLLDEIKSCDFWREGYEFLETMKLINVDNYTFGDTCSIVKPQHKSFRGYVFRDKRTGKLFRSILSNLWTNAVGHSEILPITKKHVKIEPLGVLVER